MCTMLSAPGEEPQGIKDIGNSVTSPRCFAQDVLGQMPSYVVAETYRHEFFEGTIIEQMTKGQRMAQRKGQETSEEPETLGEARESCMEEEDVKVPGAWVGVG